MTAELIALQDELEAAKKEIARLRGVLHRLVDHEAVRSSVGLPGGYVDYDGEWGFYACTYCYGGRWPDHETETHGDDCPVAEGRRALDGDV